MRKPKVILIQLGFNEEEEFAVNIKKNFMLPLNITPLTQYLNMLSLGSNVLNSQIRMT